MNTWTHVAGTADGTYARVYVNGVEAGSIAAGNTEADYTVPDIFIGGSSASAGYFSGTIDEVKIYNRSLSAGEINNEYLTGTTDTTPPAVASTDPPDNAVNVTPGKNITVTFSETIQAGTDYNNISLKDSSSNSVSTTNSISGSVLTIDPVSDLAYSETYTVSIPAGAVKDLSNNNLANPYSFSFTTSAQSVLTTITVSPSSASVAKGSTQTFIASPKDQFGNPVAATVTWTSSNISVGTITSGGLFTAISAGTTTITAASGVINGTAATTVITQLPGLVAFWNFNDGSGTIASDTSGNGNTGTITSATWTTGKMGSALQFDGVNDYVDAGKGASLNINGEITLMAWIKTTSAAENVITGRGLTGASDHTWEYAIENGRNTFYWANGYNTAANLVVGTIPINDGQWHHVVATANATRIEVYTDGMYDNGKDKTTSPNSNTNLRVLIGDLPGYSLYFNGTIDDVKIYNRSLSAGEINDEYLQGK
ncbi:Concanavalin A-like lectin/glucanases superfamily protein [uncultured archaeon]|nr:Concanavalin A-like lectin/glucanases superfamily protein [uncultured archaeon]